MYIYITTLGHGWQSFGTLLFFCFGNCFSFFVLDLLSDVTDVERKAAPLVFWIRM